MKIDTKYNLGDVVYCLYNELPHVLQCRIMCSKIVGIVTTTWDKSRIDVEPYVEYVLKDFGTHHQNIREEYLFATKQELLDSLC